MSEHDEMIDGLRQAVRVSPDNLPLRQHLAQTLLGFGRGEEAEAELRGALQKWPTDVRLKADLARAFEQQGKTSAAIVVLEELAKQPDAPAKARVLYARLLARAGNVEDAVRQYKKGVAADASAADVELA